MTKKKNQVKKQVIMPNEKKKNKDKKKNCAVI